jgi:hypothetical protein
MFIKIECHVCSHLANWNNNSTFFSDDPNTELCCTPDMVRHVRRMWFCDSDGRSDYILTSVCRCMPCDIKVLLRTIRRRKWLGFSHSYFLDSG